LRCPSDRDGSRLRRHGEDRRAGGAAGCRSSTGALRLPTTERTTTLEGEPSEGLVAPFALAIDQQDRIWIPNIVGDHVTRFPVSDPTKVETFKTGFSGSGLAVDSLGNVWSPEYFRAVWLFLLLLLFNNYHSVAGLVVQDLVVQVSLLAGVFVGGSRIALAVLAIDSPSDIALRVGANLRHFLERRRARGRNVDDDAEDLPGVGLPDDLVQFVLADGLCGTRLAAFCQIASPGADDDDPILCGWASTGVLAAREGRGR
jgi:hypothetical protein